MSLFYKIKRSLWERGFDVCRINKRSSLVALKNQYLNKNGNTVLLDVGANRGQFGIQARKIYGFQGKIISFEPLSNVFNDLKQVAAKDKNWIALNYALGSEKKSSEIHIARNTCSSSIMEILPVHTVAEPSAEYIATEAIQIITLDSAKEMLGLTDEKLYLKLDAQGYEEQVLCGALETLKNVDAIQMEMSLQPLYKDEIPFHTMVDKMRNRGFVLVALENGFSNTNTSELLQVEALFVKLNSSRN